MSEERVAQTDEDETGHAEEECEEVDETEFDNDA